MTYSLCTFRRGTEMHPGILLGEEIADLRKAAARYGFRSLAEAAGTLQILDQWERLEGDVHALAGRLLADRASLKGQGLLTSGEETPLAAPILYPRKILCAGSNYVDHAAEMIGKQIKKEERRPYVFLKAPTVCTAGPRDSIQLPFGIADQIDWEVELAAVIGRRGKRIPAADALSYVAGYMVINDLSARDRNPRKDWHFFTDWFAGKSFDGFAPMGPGVVPSRLVPDPQNLSLKLWVNGTLMQDSITRYMMFSVAELIEYASEVCTLEPGDVLATGTPAGVGRPRGVFLKPGDVVEAAIEGLGTLRNTMI